MFDVHFFCLFIIEIKLSMGECSYLKKKKKSTCHCSCLLFIHHIPVLFKFEQTAQNPNKTVLSK